MVMMFQLITLEDEHDNDFHKYHLETKLGRSLSFYLASDLFQPQP